MGETCLPDELRTLFLFEKLSDRQLATLCENGHLARFDPGPICIEGEAATCFYVLIEGELVMSKRSGGADIETNRTSQRGVYCGAWSAFVAGVPQVYESSVRVSKPSKFFVLDAVAFGDFVKAELPMAVHLLEGLKVGGLRQRQIIDQREKLLALGQLSAGLTHQLNNPAAAAARAVSDLREKVAGMRHKLAMLADGKFSPDGLRVLVTIQEEVAEQVAKSKALELTALEASDREDTIGDWLDDHGIVGAWDYAPTFVEAGLDTDWLERISASIDAADASASLQGAIGWLKYTIDTELMMNQIAEASSRISALLAGAKQYSQMDRAPYQSANVHELLRSTIMMFGEKIGKDKPVKLVKEMDHSLPELLCYPGDLNQVWTNIIDNAIQAMGGHGTLTIRTSAVGEDAVKVEICDDGPGIPKDIVDRIFTPFFTTKAFGEGTGLGLDLAWRIVAQKHHGNIRVESTPGDTRFIIILPLVAPKPEEAPRGIVATTRRVDPGMAKPQLGKFGVFGRGATPAQAKDIEALGYGAIWVGGSPPAELEWVEPILEATTTLQVATGIVNIWTAAAGPVAESFHRIDEAYPNRFLLGIGVGHPEAHQEYKKPYDALVEYLDELDEHGVPKDRRVVAALGPQVLKVSARRSAGAHPYLTTPEHTAQARELIGPDAFLAPEHKVVLTTDDEQARAVGREALEIYLNLANYTNNWKRLGFTDADIAKPGSDELVDAFVAHGTVEAIAARLKEHLAAGADHVPVQVLTGTDTLVPALAELAGPLGLQ